MVGKLGLESLNELLRPMIHAMQRERYAMLRCPLFATREQRATAKAWADALTDEQLDEMGERETAYAVAHCPECGRAYDVDLPPSPYDVSAIAQAFHDEYETQAIEHGWQTQRRSRVVWNDVPSANRLTMLATVHALIERGVIAVR